MRALKYSVDLAVYIKSDISVTVIHLRPTSTIVVGIYRLPSANKDSVEPLGELLVHYHNDEFIITGVFNLIWLAGSLTPFGLT